MGEFVNDVRLAALEKGRADALVAAEQAFQIVRDSGGNAVTAQATRDASIAAAHAAFTAGVARLVLPSNVGKSK
jgi:hypothetical protein